MLVKILISSLLLSVSANAQQSISNTDIFQTAKIQKNYIKNPSALKNLNGTSTSSATLTRDTDTADKLDGVASFNCDTSANGGYCLFQTNTIQEGDKTGSCEASITYKGDASLYSLRITDGTNTLIDQALLSVSDWQLVSVNYPCGATRDVRLVQTTAGTSAAVNLGRIYYGPVTNVVTASVVTDWKDFPSVAAGTLITATTTNPTYGTVDENIAQYRYVGDSAEIRWSFKSSVAGTAGSGNYLFNIPSSICVIDTAKTGTNGSARNQKSVVGHFKMVYGTTTVATGSAHVYNSSQIYFETSFVNSSSGLSAGQWGSSFLNFTAAESISALITVPCQGRSSNTTAARADQTDFGWTDGGSITVGATTTAPTKGTMTRDKVFYTRKGQNLIADYQFAMSTAGTNGSGDYLISIPNSLTVDTTIKPAFNGTLTNGGAVNSGNESFIGSGAIGDGSGSRGSMKCFLYSSTQFRCAVEVAHSSYGNFGTLYGFGAAKSFGVQIVVPISGWAENQKAPVLVGGVTTSLTGAARIEYVSFGGSTVGNSACAASPCTLWTKSDAISSVTRSSAGVYVVNFASGTWSSAPVCTYSGYLTESKVRSATTTSVEVSTRDSSFNFSDGVTNQVTCMGPR